MLRWTSAASERVGEAREARQWAADAIKIERKGAESLSMLKLLQPAQRYTSGRKLSEDERIALELTASGYTLSQVADQLNCSTITVRRLLAAARDKYSSANTRSLIARAIENGEISAGAPIGHREA
jgi:DNA-binding CsgD family transcriptional regulator